jgi:hypothetical protein
MNQNRVTEPVRLLVERARREMNVTGPLRFIPGGKCPDGGAIVAPYWDHWQIIHRQPRQRYHTARWAYLWFPTKNMLECRQKDFRFTVSRGDLTRHDERRILNRYRRMPLDLALLGGGGKIKGQWELP